MFSRFILKCKRSFRKIYLRKYHNISKTATIARTAIVLNPDNLYMGELTNIDFNAVVMNTRAKFIMKKWSGAAFGLTVVTGNHISVCGMHLKQVTNDVKNIIDPNHEYDKDIVVDESVWIASNVTLLSGSHIGRGSIIGSGSVVRGNILPYSIVVGNPAKIIGFVFTPQQVKEHEEKLYMEDERIDLEKYERNYNKYFINRAQEIKNFLNK